MPEKRTRKDWARRIDERLVFLLESEAKYYVYDGMVQEADRYANGLEYAAQRMLLRRKVRIQTDKRIAALIARLRKAK